MVWAFVPMAFSGWLATLAGWYTTEIGRQPWLVTGVLSTDAAVGDVAPALVATTLVAYLAIYAALLLAYISVLVYLATRKAKGGLKTAVAGRPASGAVQSMPAE